MIEYDKMTKADLIKELLDRDAEITALKKQMKHAGEGHVAEIKRLVSPGAAGFETIMAEIATREKEITALQGRQAKVQDLPLREVEKNAVSARYQKDINRLRQQIDAMNDKLTEV